LAAPIKPGAALFPLVNKMKQPYNSYQSAAPDATPISLAEAKEHLYITDSDRDDYITALIGAAVAHLDGSAGILGRCMYTQSWTMNYDEFSNELALPFPVSSIASVKFYDSSNVQQNVSVSDYELVTQGHSSFIRFKSTYQMPALYDYRTDVIEVIAIAGYGDSAAIPLSLKHAIKLLVANWFDNRTPIVQGGMPLPLGFDAIVEPYRIQGRT
jgi:uncharacterized phiE125 gp8 family phage protein